MPEGAPGEQTWSNRVATPRRPAAVATRTDLSIKPGAHESYLLRQISFVAVGEAPVGLLVSKVRLQHPIWT